MEGRVKMFRCIIMYRKKGGERDGKIEQHARKDGIMD